MNNSRNLYERRRGRVRYKLRVVGAVRPRLSVFRSSKHIYAQIIDDVAGRTLTSASSLEKELRPNLKTGADTNAATQVGTLVAKRAREVGISDVIFDRGGYRYHGRVKALAEAARKNGLSF